MTARRAVRAARVYDEPEPGTTRILVDRLWPRGIAKDSAPFEDWLKQVAPTTELRKWYNHQPERFAEFARRYRQELEEGPARDALASLRSQASTTSLVLVTATKDLDRSAAAVLVDVLSES